MTAERFGEVEGDDHLVETILDIPIQRKRWIIAVLCSCEFLFAMEVNMAAVMIPTIGRALHSSLTDALAIGTAYLLASAVLQPVFAEISYAIGRKPVFMFGLVLYIAGSILVATSNSTKAVLLGRAVQGIGGSGPSVLEPIIVTDMFYLRERAQWLNTVSAFAALGSIFGPVVAGALSARSWRYPYWFQVAFSISSLLGVTLAFPLDRPVDGVRHSIPKVDWMGIALTVPTFVSCLIPLVMGGSAYAWTDVRIIVPLVLGFVIGLPLLVCQQMFFAKKPMFNPALFANRTSITGFVACVVVQVNLYMSVYYLCFFYQEVATLPPIKVGLAILPATLTLIPTLVITGILIRLTGSYHWANISGWTLSTISIGLFMFLKPGMPITQMVLLNIPPGIGIGLSLSSIGITIQRAVPPAYRTHAVTMGVVFTAAGQCLGVALGGVIFTNALATQSRRMNLAQSIHPERVLEAMQGLKSDEDTKLALRTAIANALRYIWIFGCALAGCMGLVLATVQCKPLPTIPEATTIESPESVNGAGDVKMGKLTGKQLGDENASSASGRS